MFCLNGVTEEIIYTYYYIYETQLIKYRLISDYNLHYIKTNALRNTESPIE